MLLNKLSDTFADLHQLNMDFNHRCQFGKNIVQEKVFFSLHNSFVCLENVLAAQSSLHERHFTNFFNYWSEETIQLKEVNFLIIISWLLQETLFLLNIIRIKWS